MRRIMLIAMLLAITLAAAPPSVPETAAEDESPCGYTYQHQGRTVQDCPLWRGNVPVYGFPGSGRPVGYLTEGGTANWFVCQDRYVFSRYVYHELENHWWAYTLSDNGQWGWVPEVYFSGGENYEMDGGLRRC